MQRNWGMREKNKTWIKSSYIKLDVILSSLTKNQTPTCFISLIILLFQIPTCEIWKIKNTRVVKFSRTHFSRQHVTEDITGSNPKTEFKHRMACSWSSKQQKRKKGHHRRRTEKSWKLAYTMQSKKNSNRNEETPCLQTNREADSLCRRETETRAINRQRNTFFRCTE